MLNILTKLYNDIWSTRENKALHHEMISNKILMQQSFKTSLYTVIGIKF